MKAAPAPLRETLLVLALTFVTFVLFLPRAGFEADLDAWIDWIAHLRRVPLSHIHETTVNYPPVWLYILQVIATLVPQEVVARHIYLIKVIPLAFDFATCALAAWMLARHDGRPHRVAFIALNAAFLYNSLLWGQMDSIYTFFVFAALASVLRGGTVLSCLFLVLALNTKLQAVVFAPCLAWLILRREPRRLVTAIAAAAVLQALLLLPFILAGTLGTFFRRMAAGSLDLFPLVSLNAYNIWHLVFHDVDPARLSDQVEIFGVAARTWGMALYFLNLGVIVFLLARSLRNEGAVWLAFGLAGTAFFLFPTQMHERYLCAALVFLGMYALTSGDPWSYVLVSLGQLLNLDGVLRAIPVLDRVDFLLRPQVAAGLILAGYVLGLWRLIGLKRAAFVRS